jgi:hypothetical protein
MAGKRSAPETADFSPRSALERLRPRPPRRGPSRAGGRRGARAALLQQALSQRQRARKCLPRLPGRFPRWRALALDAAITVVSAPGHVIVDHRSEAVRDVTRTDAESDGHGVTSCDGADARVSARANFSARSRAFNTPLPPFLALDPRRWRCAGGEKSSIIAP